MDKHTPAPWEVGKSQRTVVYCNGQQSKIVAHMNSNDLYVNNRFQEGEPQANAERIVACVNACAGQSIETVKLATAHRDACFEWERSMGECIGTDSPASVVKAIEKLRQERDTFKAHLDTLLSAIEIVVKTSRGAAKQVLRNELSKHKRKGGSRAAH